MKNRARTALYLLALLAGSPAIAAPLIDPNNFDPRLSAADDFYRYSNGGWLARTTIPDEYGRWGSFEQLAADVEQALRRLVEAPSTAPGWAQAFYRSGMDTARIEARSPSLLAAHLADIEAVRDAPSLARAVADLHRLGAGVLFTVGAAPDAQNSAVVMTQLVQGGLTLPERDYYFAETHAELRAAYVAHLRRVFVLLGSTPSRAEAQAAAVMRVETALAEASLGAVERRDPHATYNRRNLAELTGQAAGFAWDAYFSSLGLPDPGPINVEHPPFFARVGELAAARPDDVRTYLTWCLASRAAPYAHEALVQEVFDFFGRTLQGTQALPPRWKRVLRATDAHVGEDLGKLYVAEHFSSEARDRARHLVARVTAALRQTLGELPWMGAQTRARALEKLDRLTVKVGYPDVWTDYGALALGPDYLDNVWRARAFALARDLSQVGGPVDRSRWEMTPQTVNAYYNPQTNEIVFPAAILQFPFFDPAADEAFNYGGIGGVIGHELTHGFDDQGRQFDAEGNLRDWWQPEDAARFEARASLIVQQFDRYTLEGKAINGALTQGENIADLGGAKVALRALHAALDESGAHASINGFTPDQRFFLAWSQIWRNQVRRETALQRLDVDPHAPGQWRVNGPLSNLPEFYEAFGVQPGDGMYRAPSERVSIW